MNKGKPLRLVNIIVRFVSRENVFSKSGLWPIKKQNRKKRLMSLHGAHSHTLKLKRNDK